MSYHYIEQSIIDNRHPLTFTVIGAGGTGSCIINNLARINHALIALGRKGISVQLCDDDTVSPFNIGRSIYYESDIGRFKADIAIERVNRAFGTKWQSITRRFDENMYQHGSTNFYISCVDTGKARKEIHNIIKLKNQRNQPYQIPYYWLDCGNTKNTGQVILGTLQAIKQPSNDDKHNLKHVIEFYPNIHKFDKKEEQGPSCSTMEALSKQSLFINNIIATLASDLLYKLIKDFRIDYQGVFYNGDELQLNPIKL